MKKLLACISLALCICAPSVSFAVGDVHGNPSLYEPSAEGLLPGTPTSIAGMVCFSPEGVRAIYDFSLKHGASNPIALANEYNKTARLLDRCWWAWNEPAVYEDLQSIFRPNRVKHYRIERFHSTILNMPMYQLNDMHVSRMYNVPGLVIRSYQK